MMGLSLLYVIFLVEETVIKVANNKIGPEEIVDRVKKQAIDDVDEIKMRNIDERNNCKELVTVLNNAWYCFVVTFKKREGYKRACTCLLLATILLGYFIRGERYKKKDVIHIILKLSILNRAHGILYLFTRKMFSCDAPEYARYTTVNSTISHSWVTNGIVVRYVNSRVLENFQGHFLFYPY